MLAARFGPIVESLGASRRLTVSAVEVRYLAPVRSDDEVRVDVVLDRITKRSIRVHYDAFVDGEHVAEASSRYVCLDAGSGKPTSLPEEIA